MKRLKPKLIILSIILSQTTLAANYFQRYIKKLHKESKKYPKNPDLMLNIGIFYHDKAAVDLAGSKAEKCIKKAKYYLKKALYLQPKNPVPKAYLASLLTIEGREAFWPWTKLSKTKKGIKRLDKLVKYYPKNLFVRIVRNLNNVHLPKMFKRLNKGLKDLNRLYKKLTSPRYKKERSKYLIPILYGIGLAYKKKNKITLSLKYWKKALKVSTNYPLSILWKKRTARNLKLYTQ